MDSRIHVLITTRSGGGLILAGYQARRGAGSSNHPFRGGLDQQRSESHSSLCSRLCSSNHPFKGWLDLKDLMHRCPHGSSNHPFKGWLDPAVARVDYLHSSSNHPFKGWLDPQDLLPDYATCSSNHPFKGWLDPIRCNILIN